MCASFVKLNSTNLIQDGYNSTWKYSFPGSAADFRDVVCAVQSITMYNSDIILTRCNSKAQALRLKSQQRLPHLLSVSISPMVFTPTMISIAAFRQPL
ncbi:unnamed protein product [Phytophthora lilii]|uniref:Unnamed protein product n=1 Tax=Phytophthora lilii TaxID=2077276 RepID=A0A9W6TZU6_9STRA|nr:unnamed protein product [Phytophthora lilii]